MSESPKFKDPKIKTSTAIAVAGGTKNRLARLLGVNRASVQTWGEYVPTLQAYRLQQIHPELFN